MISARDPFSREAPKRFHDPMLSHRAFAVLFIIAILIAVALVMAPTARAANDLYWDANGTSNNTGQNAAGTWGTSVFWNDSSSGSGGSVLTSSTNNTNDLHFSSGTNYTGSFTVTVSGARSANSVIFEEGTLTLSGGTSITLGGGGGVNSGLIFNSGTGANSISTALILGANAAFTNNDDSLQTITGGVTGGFNLTLNGSGSGGLTLSTASVNNGGTITNSGTGTGTTTISAAIGSNVTGITENSANSTLILSGANTSYTGSGTGTTLTAGTLQGLNSGATSVLQAFGSSQLNLNGGILQLRANGAGSNLTIATGNNVVVGGNTTIDVNRNSGTNTGSTFSLGTLSIGSNTLTVTGGNSYSLLLGSTTLTGAATFNPTSANLFLASVTGTDQNLTLGGTSTGNTIGAITTGAGGLTKNTASTWTLSGADTYSGATSISNGILNQTGTFGNTAIGVSGGTLNLQAVNAVSQNTLTVSGGTLTEAMGNALSGSASLNVTSGIATLSTANNYTGTTTLSGGTLQGVNSGIGNVLQAFSSSQLNLNGGTLQLRANGSGNNQTIAVGNNVVVGGNTTIDVDRSNGTNTGSTFSLGTLSIGANTLNVTGADSYALSIGATTLTGAAIFNPTSANLSLGSVTGTDQNLTLGGTSTGNSIGAITIGAGALTKNTASTWTLSGADTYTGATGISAGTLNQTGTFANTAIGLSGGTLSLQAANAVSQNTVTINGGALTETANNALSGSTSLAISSGTVTLSNANNYTGATTLSGGTLTLGAAGAINGSALSITGGTFTENAANALTGSTSLSINISGSLTLSQANNYTGDTTLNAGTLQGLNSGATNVLQAFGSSQLNLNAGTLQLRANGSGNNQTIAVGNNVSVGANLTIDVNRNTADTGNTFSFGTLNIGANTLNVTGGNSYALSFGATTLTGAATFNPTTANLSLASVTGTDKNLTLGGTSTGNSIGAITTGAGALTKNTASTWTLSGADTYTGATSISAGTLNQTGTFSNTAIGVSGGTLSLQAANAVSQNVVTVNGGSLTETANNALSGSTSLAISSGTATLSNANNYTGTTTLSGGTLQGLNSGATNVLQSFGSSQLNLSGGILQLRANGSGNNQTIAVGNNVVFGGNTTIDVDRNNGTNTGSTFSFGTLSIGANTLTVTSADSYGLSFGATTLTGAATFNPTTANLSIGSASGANQNLTLDGTSGGNTIGAITTGSGTLTKSNTSTWTLSGTSTYTGATAINGGTLNITGTLDNTVVTVGAGTLNLNGASAIGQNTLTLNNAGSILTENTTNALSGTASLAISSGTATLSQANNFSGTTTLNGGTLTLSNTGAVANSDIGLNGGTLQLRKDTTGGTFSADSTTIGGNTTIDVNRLTTGSGQQLSLGATSIGAFTLNVTGGNTYSLGLGPTTLTGAATFNPTLANLSIVSATGTDQNLTLGGTSTGNSIGAITTGAGALTKNTASTWTLSGADTYTGATSISAGTLNQTGTFANTAIGLSGGTLSLQAANAVSQNTVTVNGGSLTETANNALSGNTSLAISSGTVTLSNANNYTGTTTLSGGTLTLGAAGAINGSALSITGGTLTENAANALTGSTSLSINISGSLTLSQANNYTGDTTLNAGTLQGLNSGATNVLQAFGSSQLNLNAGTLQLRANGSGNNQTIAVGNNVSVGANLTIDVNRNTADTGNTFSFGTLNIGANTLTVTGGNSYGLSFGATTITGAAIFNPTTGNLSLASVTGTNQNLTLGGTSTGNSIGAITIGTGALTKNTASTWTLSGADTYTGATSISAGTLNQIGTFGNTAIGVSGGTLSLQAANAVSQNTVTVNGGSLTETVNNALSGSTSLAISSGTVTLSNANNYTGTTTLSGGTLTLGAAGAINGSALSITGGTLTENVANALTGSTSLSINISGSLTIAQANDYSGGTTISGGTITLGNAGALGSGGLMMNGGTLSLFNGANVALANLAGNGNTIQISGNGNTATLSVGSDNSSTSFSGLLKGDSSTGNSLTHLSLTKVGTGALTLSGANTYNGTTTIKGGSILIGNNSALGGSSVLLGDTTGSTNANLLTNGAFTFANTITVQSGNTGTIMLGGNTANISSFTGSVNLGSPSGAAKGATFVALGGGSADFSGVINESSSVAASGVTIGDSTHSGTVKFSNTANAYGGSTTIGNGATLEVTKMANGGSNSSIGNSGTSAGTGSAASDLVIDGATLRYTGSGDSTNRLFTFGANGATIDASASANGALNFTGTGSLVASGTGNRSLTLTGSSTGVNTLTSIIADPSSGATSLVKTGSGNWFLGGANSYTGGTIIANGSLGLAGGNDRLATTGTVTLGDSVNNTSGKLQLSDGTTARNQTLAGLVVAGSGINNRVVGGAAGTSTLTLNISGSNNFNGILGGSGTNENNLALTKTGTGTLTLSGANTYSGDTTISAGTLQLGAANVTPDGTGKGNVSVNGTLDLNTFSETINGLNGAGTIDTLAGGTPTLTIGNNNATSAFSGAIQNTSGTLTLTKIGNGTTTLSGTNTYAGPTTINAGTLQFAKQLSLYNNTTANWTAANIVVASGATASFNVGGAGEFSSSDIDMLAALGTASGGFKSGSFLGLDTTNAAGGNFTYGSSIADSNGGANALGLAKLGTGTLTLTGANSYTGATTLKAGTLSVDQLADGGQSSNIGASTSAATNLVINGSTLKYLGAAQNTDRLFSIGTSGGTIDASGSGALNFTNAGTIGFNNQAGARTLTLTGSNTGNNTLGAVIGDNAGATSLTKSGVGTWVLSGNNSYTGGTAISAGTLEVNRNNALGTNAAGTTVSTGASLRLNGVNYSTAEALTLNGSGIGGVGALTNIGTSTFAGGINVATNSTISAGGGTLTLTGGISKNGTVATLTGGGTININTIGISGSSANSDLVVDGVTVNENAANTYSGPTFIRNGGVLNANVANALPTTNGRTAITMDDSGSGSSQLALGANQAVASLTGAPSSLVNLNAQTLSIGTTSGTTTFSGIISGSGGLVKDGASTQSFSGNNSYTGTTTISGGILNANATGGDKALGGTTNIVVNTGGTLLTSSNQQFNAGTLPTMELAGGTFNTSGTSQTLGALTLTANSIIDLANGASILTFANSSTQTWTAGTIISIYNWSGDKDNGGGTDQLFVGIDAGGLTAQQLSQFQFYSDDGLTPLWSGGIILSTGEIVAVPEASTWIAGSLALVALVFAHRRRFSAAARSRRRDEHHTNG